MSETTIRAMTASDWPEVEAIYAAGIQTGHATFEPAPPATWEAFDTGKHPDLRPDALRQGLGGRLLAALIEQAEQLGVWTIQCSIFPENAASIRLHERHGFRVLGTRERIVYMSYGPEKERWRDTAILERRSSMNAPQPMHETDADEVPRTSSAARLYDGMRVEVPTRTVNIRRNI